jgi:peptidyl-prolyl cis-trans isomerase C
MNAVKKILIAGPALLLACALSAHAQNIAIVNGKPVPKARADFLVKQVAAQAEAQHQQLPPDIDQRVKDKVVTDEILAQEAEKRGLAANADFRQQLDFARQGLLVQTLLKDFHDKNPVSDAEVAAEYEKFKAASKGTEYHARHILVEKEEEAVALIQQIKGGADFAELAKKNSKDTGSGANGGDLDFAAPTSYVPEFSAALVKLKKGEMTETPVKTQFGYHIIKLEDTREAQFPPLAEVKAQIQQRLEQQKLIAFRDDLRKKAKTDFKFTDTAN